jgi:hypothetical protein
LSGVGNRRHTFDANGGLCYLEADHVEVPAGNLAGLHLFSRDDRSLGDVEGVLIQPSARRVRYFVVKRSGWLRDSRYVLPIEDIAHIDRERNLLKVDATADDLPGQQFDPAAVRRFSDDDLLTVMFSSTAA